jgi:hypothetical protein
MSTKAERVKLGECVSCPKQAHVDEKTGKRRRACPACLAKNKARPDKKIDKWAGMDDAW